MISLPLLILVHTVFAYNCEDYKRVPCPYAIDYGLKYCNIGMNMTLSSNGHKFIIGTRDCLLDTLFKMKYSGCSDLEAQAFVSHVKCYTQNNFCNLSWLDKFTIVKRYSPSAVTHPMLTTSTAYAIFSHCFW